MSASGNISAHIRHKKNIKANRLSKMKKPLYESVIPILFFQQIIQIWSQMKINAFAAQHNYKVNRYWNLQLDPSTEAVNTLQQ
jgi:hypothetical protein